MNVLCFTTLVAAGVILGGCSTDAGPPVQVRNDGDQMVVLRLLGTSEGSEARFVIPAVSTLGIVAPRRLGDVREVDILDDACRQTGVLYIGGAVKEWADLSTVWIQPDGSLGYDAPALAAVGRATETLVCSKSTP